MQPENKRTIYGAVWGMFASVAGHFLVLALMTLLLVGLARSGTALASKLITPEISEAAGLSVAVFLLVGFPAWMMALALGADLAGKIIQVFLPLATGVALLVGAVNGGLAGRRLSQPSLQERPFRQGVVLGLLSNLAGLILICLFTSWALLTLLPLYLCTGPVVGVLSIALVRRFLRDPQESKRKSDKD